MQQVRPVEPRDVAEAWSILQNCGLANTPKEAFPPETYQMFLALLSEQGVTNEELLAVVKDRVRSKWFPPFGEILEGCLTFRATTTHFVGLELPDGRLRLLRVKNSSTDEERLALVTAEYRQLGFTGEVALPARIKQPSSDEDLVKALDARFKQTLK